MTNSGETCDRGARPSVRWTSGDRGIGPGMLIGRKILINSLKRETREAYARSFCAACEVVDGDIIFVGKGNKLEGVRGVLFEVLLLRYERSVYQLVGLDLRGWLLLSTAG